MAEGTDAAEQSLPDDPEALKTMIFELQKNERQLIWNKQETEFEFGKKRAKFKELYLSREGELEAQREKAKIAENAVANYKHELQNIQSECEALRTTAALLESTQREDMDRIRSNYQEEITSLQAIMREAVKEARTQSAQQYELERHTLISANQKLGSQNKELQSKLAHDGKGSGMMSAINDAVVGAVKKSSPATSSTKADNNLEDGMKKAQRDADAWKSIVLPLEQDNETLRTKLKEYQEKISAMETKLKELQDAKDKASEAKAGQDGEEQDEKVKELSQYLESERSSRTDLEMFVAVLNTQKGVLQEDSEKLRKELHNVCRILEQEKTAHRELKKTWQMANDQFLDSQTMQNREFTRVWGILTPEQRQTIEEQRQDQSSSQQVVGDLIDIITPNSSITSLESSLQSLPHLPGEALSDIAEIPSVNALALQDEPLDREGTSDEEGGEDRGRKRAHSASDATELDANNVDVSRAKSADSLATGNPVPAKETTDDAAIIRHSPHIDLETRPRTPSKGGRIDWRVFQEEVKVSHEGEINRACVMCMNYERQLQTVQSERQKFKNLASNLQKALDQEKRALFEEQKQRSRLEESVANAGADAQAQINDQTSTLTKLEKLLTNLQKTYGAARDDATKQIAKLVASRDELTKELNRLRAEYNTLQDSALQQMTQMDTDARVMEMREQMLQLRAAGEGTEEKLRSEIAFLKDRAVAEQLTKDSMEEMLQVEVDGLKGEMAAVSGDLKSERKERQEAEAKVQKSEQLLRNIEAKSKQVIIALRGQLDEASEEKTKLEEESKRLRHQMQSMTGQLNESETVQRDFVKLSQTLQMQIAAMQESENEVRWEHKDDVTECHKCQKPLNANKDKYHCHHCGKIFCASCRSKTFTSTTSKRPHQVCDICYAILNNDPKALLDAKLAEENLSTL